MQLWAFAADICQHRERIRQFTLRNVDIELGHYVLAFDFIFAGCFKRTAESEPRIETRAFIF